MSAFEHVGEPEAATVPTDSPEASAGPLGAVSGFTGEELNNSLPISWTRTFGPAGEAMLDALLAELEAREQRKRARRANDQVNLRTTLDAFLAELLTVYRQAPTRFLAYSRSVNDYRPDRYTTAGITYTAVIAVADFLHAARYADNAIGYRDRSPNPFGGPGSFGRRTRIRARQALLDRLATFGLSAGNTRPRGIPELIRMKGPAPRRGVAKPKLDYEDTSETRRMRQELVAINALLAKTHIALAGDGVRLEQHEDNDEERPQIGDVQLYRVFNNGSFEQGGRFYGGWWMAVAKQDRARLRIDGEAVVELDFAGLHPRLAYDLAGQPLPADEDPYALPGRLNEVSRELRKKAFAQLLNTSGGVRAPPGVPAQLPRRITWQQVAAGMEKRHSPIAQWFRRGRGLELQALDARIAAFVVIQMTLRGVPCLPVHDSFLVPISQGQALWEVMDASYRWCVRGNLDQGPSPIIRYAFPPHDL